MAAPRFEHDERPFGWYAGLGLTQLSVGPLPTFDAALDAARREVGSSKTIYLVEARAAAPNVSPFSAHMAGYVLYSIDEDNAATGLVLPPLQSRHVDDLKNRLNAAVAAWLAAQDFKMIGAGLVDGRNAHAVIPHEVDSVTTRKVDAAPVAMRVGPQFMPAADHASDVKAQVASLGNHETTVVYKPGSKATRPGGCNDCGANYCHCIADVQVKP